ncbi:MAG: integrase core domain-containing protein [Microthrixaceae bacterium]
MVPDNSPDPSTQSSPLGSPQSEHLRSPQANAYAERWVRTLRRTPRPTIIWNKYQPSSCFEEYVEHYNSHRPHRGLRNEPTTPATSSRSAQANRSNVTPPAPDSSANTEPPPEPLPGQPTPLPAPASTRPTTQTASPSQAQAAGEVQDDFSAPTGARESRNGSAQTVRTEVGDVRVEVPRDHGSFEPQRSRSASALIRPRPDG